MSLSDHEARAMAVKMLNQDALRGLHRLEEKKGCMLLPHEIAQTFTQAISIKKHWGIPENPQSQTTHADRIKVEITALIRKRNCQVDLGSQESRVNFDWFIHHSDIDFAYHAATRSAAGEVETPDDVFGPSAGDR